MSDFFFFPLICHDGWYVAAQAGMDRFTPDGVHADVAEDLQLPGADYLDLVYPGDRPDLPLDALLVALCGGVSAGRVKALDMRKAAPDRLRAADKGLKKRVGGGLAAVITTELRHFTPLYA